MFSTNAKRQKDNVESAKSCKLWLNKSFVRGSDRK